MADSPEDLARGIAGNIGVMLGQGRTTMADSPEDSARGVAGNIGVMLGQGGTTLMEIITTARRLLPDFAEGDVKVQRGEIKPAEHPAARIMDQLNAKAKAEGKTHYAFLGRLIPVDRLATVEQIMSEFPQGEMEDAGMTGASVAHGGIAKELRALTREGMDELMKGKIPKTLAQQVAQKGLAVTKSAKAPKDELKQLIELGLGKAPRQVVQTYQGVLEREALAKLKRWQKVVNVLGSKPVKMAVGAEGGLRKAEEEKNSRGYRY
jgi:hypothetical protein